MRLPLVQSALLLLLSAALPTTFAGKHVLSVEPYLAEWCVAQFPDELRAHWDAHTMAAMVRDRTHVFVEPYLGWYCFETYGDNHLKDHIEKRHEHFENMKEVNRHVQIEPFLMEWGEEAMIASSASASANLEVPAVEDYVAKWCVEGQFHSLFHKNKKQEALEQRQYPVDIEVPFGRWCFKQFEEHLAHLDQEVRMHQLQEHSHVNVEDYLINWEIANFHMRTEAGLSLTKEKSGGGFFSFKTFFFLSMIVGVVGYAYKKNPEIVTELQERAQQLLGRQQHGHQMSMPMSNYDYNPLHERMVA